MLDVVANEGWLVSALSICNLVQMIVQARWLHDSSLLTLPNIDQRTLYLFRCVNHSSCFPRAKLKAPNPNMIASKKKKKVTSLV